MSQPKKSANPKVTIIASKGANQAINYLLEDRDELEWLVAIGRNHKGDIFFYDTGGATLRYPGAPGSNQERNITEQFRESEEQSYPNPQTPSPPTPALARTRAPGRR